MKQKSIVRKTHTTLIPVILYGGDGLEYYTDITDDASKMNNYIKSIIIGCLIELPALPTYEIIPKYLHEYWIFL
jgi:hypothetical protein